MPQGGSGTYYYSPDAKIYISTAKHGVIDVSEDIVQFAVRRSINAVSSANIILNNKNFKYTPGRAVNNFNKLPVINTLDRIVIFLKRQTYMQVFAGYVTYSPIITLVPSSIEINADCTLKKIQDSWWDSSAIQIGTLGLIPGIAQNLQVSSASAEMADGGVGQGMYNLLTQAAGWPKNKIHVSMIPSKWIQSAMQMMSGYSTTATSSDTSTAPDPSTTVNTLDGNGIVAGSNLTQTGPTTAPGSPQGTSIPNGRLTTVVPFNYTSVKSNKVGVGLGIKVLDDSRAEVFKKYNKNNVLSELDVITPINSADDDWWCVIAWGYAQDGFNAGRNPTDAQKAITKAKDFLAKSSSPELQEAQKKRTGKLILLTNPQNANQIGVRASFTRTDGATQIIISKVAWEALAGKSTVGNDFYYSPDLSVNVSFAADNLDQTGLQPDSDVKKKLKATNSDPKSSVQLKPADASNLSAGSNNGSNIPAKAVEIARQMIGTPYVYGAGHTGARSLSDNRRIGVDCSGLITQAYRMAGDNSFTTGNTVNEIQQAQGVAINPVTYALTYKKNSQGDLGTKVVVDYPKTYNRLLPGDLLFWSDLKEGIDSDNGKTIGLTKAINTLDADHVTMYTGKRNGKHYHIQAPYTGAKVYESELTIPPGFQSQPSALFTAPLPEWTNSKVGGQVLIKLKRMYGNWNLPVTVVSPTTPNTSTNASTSSSPVHTPSYDTKDTYNGPINNNSNTNTAGVAASNLWQTEGDTFNYAFNMPSYSTDANLLYGSARAFVTEQNVLSSIAQLSNQGLRCFQSAPNGDFISWFPDYFGLYGQAPVVNIHDIEIMDFKLYHDDNHLVTHVGISADTINLGNGVDYASWMASNGIISIQIPEVLKMLFGIPPNGNLPFTPEQFLQRYGLRPHIEEVPQIRSHIMEFMYAWQTFMRKWSEQYTSMLSLTFMPEIYPGMRIRLADHNIELYVEAVTHQGSREGGFTTEVSVTCPITRNSDGTVKIIHYGFPV